MGTKRWRNAITDDGQRQSFRGGRSPYRGRAIPMEYHQICLPETLPVSPGFFHDRVEGGTKGSPGDGTPLWHVLPGMLLDPDGALVRAGSDEPPLDCGAG